MDENNVHGYLLSNKTSSTKNKTKNKDDKIVVRIGAELKEQFTKYVENKGATVSDYIRQMIVQEMHENLTQENVGSVKEFLSEYYNPEANISKDIQTLKEKMILLEYRLNERLNENKE